MTGMTSTMTGTKTTSKLRRYAEDAALMSAVYYTLTLLASESYQLSPREWWGGLGFVLLLVAFERR